VGKNCLTEQVLLRALDEELPPRQAWLVKLHVQACESCRERIEGLRQISSRVTELHQFASPEDTAGFAAQLEWEEARKQRSPVWRRWFGPPWPRWQQLAWCAALVVALVAGLSLRTPHPRVPVRHIVQPLLPAVNPPAPKQLLAADVPAKPVRAVHHAVKKHAPHAPVSSGTVAAAPEVVTPFFALPFSDAALPLDQAAVIRVELPRSALELAGLPVDEDRRNERIRADLVLGADGLARAIRFVE